MHALSRSRISGVGLATYDINGGGGGLAGVGRSGEQVLGELARARDCTCDKTSMHSVYLQLRTREGEVLLDLARWRRRTGDEEDGGF